MGWSRQGDRSGRLDFDRALQGSGRGRVTFYYILLHFITFDVAFYRRVRSGTGKAALFELYINTSLYICVGWSIHRSVRRSATSIRKHENLGM